MQDEPSLTAPAEGAPPRQLPLRFTGSGSEYFRIWIVNLLLTLVTLGLYHPWAKVRRLKYFYGNTLVGEHPLGFHAVPAKMMRGFLLVVLLLVLYSLAGRTSPEAGLVAFGLVAAIWPALIKSSLQFRMANTSWRGLRFGFGGTLRGAYAVWLPLFIPGLLITAAQIGVDDETAPPAWYGLTVLAIFILTLALLPWLWWKLKKYQHDHYRYGPEQTTLHAGAGSFYGVVAKTVGVLMLGGLALGALAAALVGTGALAGLGKLGGVAGAGVGMAILVGGMAFGVGLVLFQFVPYPYFMSRMQNLLWSRTASPALSLRSELRFLPLFRLSLKNWFLMIVTLGLYWPFAAVAMARLRIEAVQAELHVDPDTLISQGREVAGDAAGDAAGDLFGVDIGL